MPTRTERVHDAYRRIAEADRPEVWITPRPEADLLVAAKAVEDRLAAGEELPLAGTVVAVKDNIDVAGLPTTAACPEFAYTPETSATAVRRLVDAGALVLGKTNLDQFATGLFGGGVRLRTIRRRGHGGHQPPRRVACLPGVPGGLSQARSPRSSRDERGFSAALRGSPSKPFISGERDCSGVIKVGISTLINAS
ncbi:hypothetical protein BJF83_14180 [Nocardiopsis sp. CNR-923]|uniref:amidase family protein n=1 Tax=Nocardiopsis sp. CNR-923 TaxID=1904965 RepID=UPI000959DDDB|nr:amidase family protein [Nocardiopsis sp. CNR-923]OLT28779.1 hypothetical protein BJF83_14180 [Nocardiopsis sp. CNR-923]